jgi:predicted ABC-type ATPase
VKDLVLIGGPNGAGKTTALTRLLPEDVTISEFVDADAIARGLSRFNPDRVAVRAGRLLLERIGELSSVGESFAFESTLAGHSQLRVLRHCRELGYRTTLVFLWLRSVDIAIERVADRVRKGGHSIPDHVVLRRYHAGLRNMIRLYLPAVDTALVYDNSGDAPVLIAERGRDGHLKEQDPVTWELLQSAIR